MPMLVVAGMAGDGWQLMWVLPKTLATLARSTLVGTCPSIGLLMSVMQ